MAFYEREKMVMDEERNKFGICNNRYRLLAAA